VQTGYSGATLATTGLLAFGAGMLTSYALWGGCDWDDHHVYYGGYHGGGGYKGPSYKGPTYKVNGDVNVNVGGNRQQWQHRPEHRRGVSYKNPRTRDQYARYDPKRGNFDEKKMRGHDRDANLGHRQRPGSHPAQTRPATPPKMPARPTAKPAAKTPSKAAKPQTRPAARQPERSPATGKSAFSGSRNAGVQRQASQRGAQSRGRSAGHTMARSGGGGGRGGGGGGKHRGGGRKGR
jgi:hypothetical protein